MILQDFPHAQRWRLTATESALSFQPALSWSSRRRNGEIGSVSVRNRKVPALVRARVYQEVSLARIQLTINGRPSRFSARIAPGCAARAAGAHGRGESAR